ncbi:hypothetical protein GCM10027280_11660 [Micromonospora polyrhachis]
MLPACPSVLACRRCWHPLPFAGGSWAKAHLDRPKDRADPHATVLDQAAREWLADALELLGHDSWARWRRTGESGQVVGVPGSSAVGHRLSCLAKVIFGRAGSGHPS